MCNMSCVTCHLSHVTSHMSRVTCHMSHFFFFSVKVLEPVGGGSVINEANPRLVFSFLVFLCSIIDFVYFSSLSRSDIWC